MSAVPTLSALFTDIGHAGPEAPIGGIKHTPPVPRGVGQSLTVVATLDNSVEVGFFPTTAIDSSQVVSASIDWGDGSAPTAGTLVYTTENGRSGYQITGDHTYATAGNFKINTTLTSTPAPTPPISATPIRLLSRILSKVTVLAPTSPSTSGVVLHEPTGESFTDTLGTFITPAPGTNLKATIFWGDGTSSAGTLNASGTSGVDLLAFDVDGTHSYARAGTYSVLVTLTRKLGKHTTQLSSFESSVVVATPTPINVAGSFNGTYTIVSTLPDLGNVEDLTGSGTAGDLGAVSLTGSVHRSGFIFPSTLSGTVTLTNSQGSVTVALTSPLVVALDGVTSSLKFTLTAGTGAYANTSAAGSVTLTLTPGATDADPNTFTLALT